MPTALIDDFSDETLWQALTPGNVASAEIVLGTDRPSPTLAADSTSMRAGFSSASAGHRIERSFAPVDLSDFSELRLWVRADAPASGAPGAPFRLEMRLGSAALPIGAPGNDWHRRLPAEPAGRWAFVRLALDDLDPAVRAVADRIAFFSLPAPDAGGVTVWLDDLRAATPRLVSDADSALIAALDGKLQIGGNPVPAAIDASGGPPIAGPAIRIVNYDAVFAEARGGQGRRRGDYTQADHRIWPEPEPWDLLYRIDFVSADRSEQAAMLDFTLATLGGRGLLDVGGIGQPIERVANVMPDDALSAAPLLRYRVACTLDRGAPLSVLPVAEIRLATGHSG
ncbi:MAG TPA: hypothetical protein VF759_10440 [Allosphingosinicella sp.]